MSVMDGLLSCRVLRDAAGSLFEWSPRLSGAVGSLAIILLRFEPGSVLDLRLVTESWHDAPLRLAVSFAVCPEIEAPVPFWPAIDAVFIPCSKIEDIVACGEIAGGVGL